MKLSAVSEKMMKKPLGAEKAIRNQDREKCVCMLHHRRKQKEADRMVDVRSEHGANQAQSCNVAALIWRATCA